jgi:hypothetical protein
MRSIGIDVELAERSGQLELLMGAGAKGAGLRTAERAISNLTIVFFAVASSCSKKTRTVRSSNSRKNSSSERPNSIPTIRVRSLMPRPLRRGSASGGLALGVAMAGVGLGIILVPQFTRLLIETYGWRHTYVGLGAVVFAVVFLPLPCLVANPRRRADASSAWKPRPSRVSALGRH